MHRARSWTATATSAAARRRSRRRLPPPPARRRRARPRPRPARAGSVATSAAGVGDAPSTVSRASNRLASTALGSARAGRRRHAASPAGSAPPRTRLRGARLGAGLTTVPAIPAVDAAKAILKDPQVPEDKRVCPSCGAAVGRSRDGQPGRTEGFCPQCRNPFSFTPKLQAGDLVGGQYEVAGAIAHGGLGWIYVARDRNVSDRWVVLKGLLNSGDPDAVAAAIAEQQFLAQVEHPLIVEIYNFVTHEGAGYIVMEYVGGTSLKALLKARMRAAGGRYDPLPVDQAIAYVIEILPAFQYLHDMGLVYCDFKPDNIIQVGDAVKLIDMGGVRRIDDLDSAIYGTVGYQAPEVPQVGTSVASDIYTIGRTLMVLAMEFRGYQSTYVASLPPVSATPLFQQHDSLYRLLAKACAPDPADRFASADELRVQLLGVLREVVAARDARGRRRPALDVLAAVRVAARSPTSRWSGATCPRCGSTTATRRPAGCAPSASTTPAPGWPLLQRRPRSSAEVLLATGRAALEAGRTDVVDAVVRDMLGADPWEWRAVWLSGLAALATDDAAARRRRSTRSTARCPASWRPSWRWRWPARPAASSTWPSRSMPPARAPTPTTSPRPRSGWPGSAPPAATSTARSPRWTSCRRPAGPFTSARRQRAGLLADSGRGLPALAEAMGSIDVPDHRADRTAPAWPSTCCRRR